MTDKLTFIHAADLHLDSPFKGLSNLPEHIFTDVWRSTYTVVDRLVETAIAKKVDFVLLAGDLFDNERQSLQAQITLRNAFETLKRYGIHVYLSYGNHDHISGNTHYMSYPDNVFCFPDEKVRCVTYQKEGMPKAAIYGFSYENQAILTNKAYEYQVKNESIPFHIAMLHGSLGKNTEHHSYAPFQLNDLLQSGMDYWALGHIHRRSVLKEHPPVVYPGNTQGRHRKEAGEKGCYHVTLTKAGATLSFIPLQSILFNNDMVDVSKCSRIDDLESMLKIKLDQLLTNQPQLLHLTLRGQTEQLVQWEKDFVIDELIDMVNTLYTKQKNWLYIYKVNIDKQRSQYETQFVENDFFIHELNRQMTDVSMDTYLKTLYQHRQARKYLEPLSVEELEKINKEAYHFLLNALQR